MSSQVPFKNIIIHGAGQFINLLAPFLVALYVIPVCGIDKWGIVGVVTSVYVLLGLLIEFGANLIGVKELSAYRSKKVYLKNYIGLNYKYRLVSCVLLTIILIFLFIGLNVDKTYYWGLTWIIAWYYNPIWFFQAQESFKKINRIIFWSKLIYILCIYFIIKSPKDYIYVVGILGFSNSLVYAWFYYQIPQNKSISLKRVFVFVLQNKSIVLSNFAISCYTQAPVFIINAILGNTVAGVYKVIDLFLVAFRSYLGVFFNVTYPNFCYLMANSFKDIKSYVLKINLINIVFLLITAFTIILLMPYVIDYFQFSEEVQKGLKLSSYLLFLPVIIALNIPFYQTLLFTTQNRKVLVISLIGLVLTIVFGIILTKIFGLIGVILTLYLTEFFITSCMWFNGRKELIK